MRRLTLLLFALVVGYGQTPVPSGTIHGTVKDEATGLPLSGAMVQAAQRWAADGAVLMRADGGVLTDDQGRYSLPKLHPGGFQVIAFHSGRAPATRDVEISAGQDLAIDLLLASNPSLSGKVLDENAKPARQVFVWLIQSEYRSGALRRSRIGPRHTSDDGSFTFDSLLQSGRAYYLLAEHAAADRQEPRIEAPTYYGESTSLEAAAPLILSPGEQRQHVDITMRMAAQRCVDGEVRADGKPASSFVAIQQAALTGTDPTLVPTFESAEDGSFHACGLTPGDYVISTAIDNLSARELVTVADSDVHRVFLNVAPASLHWELAWDGDPPAVPKEEAPVSTAAGDHASPLSADEFSQLTETRMRRMTGLPLGPQISATLWRTDADGQVHFSMPAPYIDGRAITLSAGDYYIQATVASGSYVKEITFGGVAVTDGMLHLAAGSSATLRIVATQGGSSVTARVTDSDDNAVSGATVIVMPESVVNAAQFSALARPGATDSNGAYTSRALAPGKYRVLALTRSYQPTPEDIDRILVALSKAQTVEIGPRTNVQVALRPVPID